GEVDEQAGERVHLNAGQVRGGLLEHGQALLQREQGLLRRIDQHCHDQLVEVAAGPFDDVQMAVGHGIEGPGTQRGGARDQTSRYKMMRVSPYSRRLATRLFTRMTSV